MIRRPSSKNHETQERRETKTESLADNALVFELGVVAKVDQQAELVAGRFKVVVDLGAMLVGQSGNRF